MTPERWKLIKEVFEAASERDVSSRASFLNEACKGDAVLRSEVERLLSVQQPTGDFLEHPIARVLARVPDDATHSDFSAARAPQMTIGLGSRIGSYEITALLGEGGMGRVWRAHHTALKRDDALKVLPDAFASDPEQLARFRREARVLASLNHPNIAHVHGLEQADGVQALVMELVDGPTLADRIAQGPIPVDEALPIAKQIAEALEAAHEQGIIHRDLKPANIKVRRDGTVKVLDFGLAKAMEPVGSSSDMSQVATVTSPALMTSVGVILGTAAYMSPEQARGKTVDRRTDIWAFGCVLYEMLTGRRAFEGDEVSSVLARILERDPDYSAVPATAPASVRRVLRRCLEKDPRRRLRHVGDVLVELDETDEPNVGESGSVVRWRGRRLVAAVFSSACIGGVLAGLVVWMNLRSGPMPAQYFAVGTVGAERPWISQMGSIAVSPDGRQVAYLSILDGLRQLRIWSVESGTAMTLVPDGLPAAPFFSPDGRSIGFYDEADSALKRVAVQGGTIQTICRFATSLRGATWLTDDTIVFGISMPGTGLLTVPATGGRPRQVTKVGDVQSHRWPAAIGPARAVIFTVYDAGQAHLAALNLDTGAESPVLPHGSHAQYLSSGHLVYASNGGIAAVQFDAARLAPTGDSVNLVERVQTSTIGLAEFDVSANGSLVYVPATSIRRAMGWVDRTGRMTEIVVPGDIRYPRLSPDGSKVAFAAVGRSPNAADIWIRDLRRGSEARLTVDATNIWPVWRPDGLGITFGSNRGTPGSFDLYDAAADSSGEPTRLADTSIGLPGSWTPGATTLIYTDLLSGTPDGNSDLWILPHDGGGPKPLLTTRFSESAATLSSNGGWLAYVSDQTGEPRVYMQAFPAGGRIVPVSTGRGTEPVWSRDGSALYYRDANRLMVVDIRNGDLLAPPRVLFTAPYDADINALGYANYDVSADGERFLMIGSSDDLRSPGLYVQNWHEELKRLVPTR
jgi:serine/threonine-protein kinase